MSLISALSRQWSHAGCALLCLAMEPCQGKEHVMSALCSFYVPELGVPEDHSMHLPLVVLTSEWTVTIPGIASVVTGRFWLSCRWKCE